MARKKEPDFLDELIEDGRRRDPEFPALVEAALERRRVAAELARARDRLRLSQTDVAQRMRTAQSVISKLEAGGDVKVSTLLKYAEVVGKRLAWSASRATRRGARARKNGR